MKETDRKVFSLSRRELLRLGKAFFLLSGISLVYPVGRYISWDSQSRSLLAVTKKDFVLNSEWKPIQGSRVWLRQGEDGPEGLLATCTHLGCEVKYQAGEWICPCHGSRYGEDGRLLQGPAAKPLRRLKVEETSDRYRVETSAHG